MGTILRFEGVEVLSRDALGFRCRVDGKVVHVGALQWKTGTDVMYGGTTLILDAADARSLGLIS